MINPAALFFFLAVFGLYLSGASPAIAPRDAADMAGAAWTLGVAHPPGYPLYAALGRAWLAAFPLGNPAYRLAVLSALAAAGAAAFLFAGVRRRCGLWAGLAASAIFVFSAPLWKFALIQEKYSLHALFAAVLLFLSEGERNSFWRRVRLSGLLVGLGLVNHQSLLLWLPGLFWLWRRECSRQSASGPQVAAAGFSVRLPTRVLCTDNAAMIAHAAWRRLTAGGVSTRHEDAADPALPLHSWA